MHRNHGLTEPGLAELFDQSEWTYEFEREVRVLHVATTSCILIAILSQLVSDVAHVKLIGVADWLSFVGMLVVWLFIGFSLRSYLHECKQRDAGRLASPIGKIRLEVARFSAVKGPEAGSISDADSVQSWERIGDLINKLDQTSARTGQPWEVLLLDLLTGNSIESAIRELNLAYYSVCGEPLVSRDISAALSRPEVLGE